MSFLFVPGWPGFLLEMAVGGLMANAGTGLLITGALGVTVVLGFAAAYWLAGVPEPAHGRPGPVQRAGTAVRRASGRAAAGWERRPVLPADDAATIAWVGELHHDDPPSWALPAPTAPLALPAPPVTFVSSPPVLPASSPAGTGDGPAPVRAVTPDVPSPAVPDETPGSGPAAGLGTTPAPTRGDVQGRAVRVCARDDGGCTSDPGPESRPAARADLTGSLSPRPHQEDPGPVAHAGPGPKTGDGQVVLRTRAPQGPLPRECDGGAGSTPALAVTTHVPGRVPATAHTPGPPPSPAREGRGASPAGDPRWPWLDRPWDDDTGSFAALCREGT